MLASSAARWLPREFVETSRTGGVFTLVAYGVMLAAFVMELASFLSPSYSTRMMLDRLDGDKLQINFDIDLYNLECRNLHVAVFAQGSEERLSTQDFWLRPIDKNGMLGHAVRPGEPPVDGEEDHRKVMEQLARKDGAAELDADWDSSHDGFKHQSFEHVIQGHDFTFINFFAGWCSHCQHFAPQWNNIAQKINGAGDQKPMEFMDSTRKIRTVRMIKMNCVDFKQLCMTAGIDAFPTLRLYKSDGKMIVFNARRTEEAITDFVRSKVSEDRGFSHDHIAFETGCNAKGRLEVPRVPGRLELRAGAGDQNLVASMANVSHLVKHLSFSDPEDGRYHRKNWASLPREVTGFLNPMDGQMFISREFHQTWIHDLKVVSTVSAKGRTVYQVQHQKRLAKVPVDEIPQAKFHFDIEPFSIYIEYESKRWYDFCTSVLAITGGCFMVMRLLSRLSVSTLTALQRLLKGASGSVRSGGMTVGHFD